MAASNILAKFSARTTIPITLGALASSTVGLGRVSSQVDNTVNRYTLVKLFVSILCGTSPTAGTGVFVYLVQGNGTEIVDNAGVLDAGLTVINSVLIGTLGLKPSPLTGDVVVGEFDLPDPGPYWSIAIVHNQVAALGTGASNSLSFVGCTVEAQ